MADDKKYTVELENEGCPHCGEGKQWMVIDPDGIGGGETYGDHDAAEDVCEMMNDALYKGRMVAVDFVLRAVETAINDALNHGFAQARDGGGPEPTFESIMEKIINDPRTGNPKIP